MYCGPSTLLCLWGLGPRVNRTQFTLRRFLDFQGNGQKYTKLAVLQPSTVCTFERAIITILMATNSLSFLLSNDGISVPSP